MFWIIFDFDYLMIMSRKFYSCSAFKDARVVFQFPPTLDFCKLNKIYCKGLYLTISVNIASNGSILGSIDLLLMNSYKYNSIRILIRCVKCLYFVNIWRHFLSLNKDQPIWTDSLCWKSEQNIISKCWHALHFRSVPLLNCTTWIETIAETQLRYTK